jgi:hypothetical protein
MGGMLRKKAYKIQNRLKMRINDIIDNSVSFHSTIDTIIDNMCKMVWEDKDLKRCPEWVRSYLRGYYEAKWNEMWNKHFTWLLFLDGRLLTHNEVDDQTEKEKVNGFSYINGVKVLTCDPNYKSPWSRIDGDKSRHVWKGKNGEPLRDKPIDQKWRESHDCTSES